MAKITMNPKRLKKGEVRITDTSGRKKETARQKANRAADAFAGLVGDVANTIRNRGIVPGAKHRSE